MLTVGVGNVWGDSSFDTTYGYSGKGTTWSLTNCDDMSKDSYWLCPNGSNTTSVALIEGIFSGKTITSAVTITINNATYGSGTSPSSTTFKIYNSSACSSQVTATQGGTLASSSSYVNTTYSITLAHAANFSDDLAILITKPGRQIRLKSIRVQFSYTVTPTYTIYLPNTACSSVGSYTSNKGTSGSGTGTWTGYKTYSGITSGTSVTITASPESGYQFDGWIDNDVSIIMDDQANEITPSSTTSTTATFDMPSADVYIMDCYFSSTCANSVTISKGTATNCDFSLSPSDSQYSCDGVTTTVSITPTSGYGTPVVTQSGASKTPSISGSGNTQTVTYASNTTGTSAISVSCSANTYTITLDKDLTPTTAGTASITATYNSNSNLTSAITKPTATGWTFAGYYTAKNGGGTQIIDADGNVLASKTGYTDGSKNWKYAGNITLYAKWTCTVTWSVNQLTNVYSANTLTYNATSTKVASIPGPPSPASYCGDKFVGWTSVENYVHGTSNLFTTVAGSPELKTVGDITFYAVFADYDE